MIPDADSLGSSRTAGLDIALGIPDHDRASKAPETEVVTGTFEQQGAGLTALADSNIVRTMEDLPDRRRFAP